MASWRIAAALDTLLEQINQTAPGRNKAHDGSIGDQAHQARQSDHNPDAGGVVRARDFTHDPDHGCDIEAIFEAIRLSRDPRTKYAIFHGRIFSSYPSAGGTITGPGAAWEWREYRGGDPVANHDYHGHLSVVAGDAADDTYPWTITTREDDIMALLPIAYGDGIEDGEHPEKRSDVAYLQNRLNVLLPKSEQITADGFYGDATATAMVKVLGLAGTGKSDQTGRLCTGGHWWDIEKRMIASAVKSLAPAGTGGITQANLDAARREVDAAIAEIDTAIADIDTAIAEITDTFTGHTHVPGKPR